jgi:xylan 1,4-beta-xylosidase
MNRRLFLEGGLAAGAAATALAAVGAQIATEEVRIDIHGVQGALPHIWEECAGSDRAAITLRESWRHDLDRWHREAGLKRVRFHGILNDELGVDAASILSRGKAASNFRDVDEVYDGLVERGVAPFVELSFMPKALASGERSFGFYNGNITPPASLDAWSGFITLFAGHLCERYGLAAVRAWPFEVWNEPNLPFFWSGSQQQYFDFYKATAVALKSVDPHLQVGGPATAQAAWLPEFLGYCAQHNAPVDFVSTHAYAGDKPAPGTAPMPYYAVIPDAVARSRREIDATAFRGTPLWFSEWSADSPAMIAHILTECLPNAHAMSHWVMSGTYEELGVANYSFKEGDMGYGTMVRGVPLPTFNTYKLLHALGTTRLAAAGPALASRRADGSVAALVWNLADVKQASGIPGALNTREVKGAAKRLRVRIAGARANSMVRVRFVDQQRGSPMPAWRAMGSPRYPTLAQFEALRRSAAIAPPTPMRLDGESSVILDLPPEGIALIEMA